jgi:hypothetical protein
MDAAELAAVTRVEYAAASKRVPVTASMDTAIKRLVDARKHGKNDADVADLRLTAADVEGLKKMRFDVFGMGGRYWSASGEVAWTPTTLALPPDLVGQEAKGSGIFGTAR